MMGFWKGLSPFTRRLAVFVLVTMVVGGYARLRLKPLRAEMQGIRKEHAEIARTVQEARQRVNQLERESELAQRWMGYSKILEEQSTGHSLNEILATCGTETGPSVDVMNARFEREVEKGRFQRMGVHIEVGGSYQEVLTLLHELDRAFPPIELRAAQLRAPEQNENKAAGHIVAKLDGVIHEPR